MTRRVAIVILMALMAVSAWGRSAPVNIPSGTQVQVRMIDNLTSETAKEGDTFRATLHQAIVVNGRTLFAKGSDVSGRVVRAKTSGRLSDPGELELVITSVRSGNSWVPLNVEPLLVKGDSHAKSNVGKIGGGAAAGAIIGAIAGGGKGAAIGAGAGAAAGTATAAATGKKEAKVESEALLTWVVSAPTPAPDLYSRGESRDRGRARDNDRDYDDDDYRERDRRHDRHSDYDDSGAFSARDRRLIRSCFDQNYSNLPPGLAKKDRLPPGLERQVQRNGTLPPGLQKRVQPLPQVCDSQLPRIPRDWERVVLSGRVILLGGGSRILDLFYLDSND